MLNAPDVFASRRSSRSPASRAPDRPRRADLRRAGAGPTSGAQTRRRSAGSSIIGRNLESRAWRSELERCVGDDDPVDGPRWPRPARLPGLRGALRGWAVRLRRLSDIADVLGAGENAASCAGGARRSSTVAHVGLHTAEPERRSLRRSPELRSAPGRAVHAVSLTRVPSFGPSRRSAAGGTSAARRLAPRRRRSGSAPLPRSASPASGPDRLRVDQARLRCSGDPRARYAHPAIAACSAFDAYSISAALHAAGLGRPDGASVVDLPRSALREPGPLVHRARSDAAVAAERRLAGRLRRRATLGSTGRAATRRPSASLITRRAIDVLARRAGDARAAVQRADVRAVVSRRARFAGAAAGICRCCGVRRARRPHSLRTSSAVRPAPAARVGGVVALHRSSDISRRRAR